MGNLHTTTYRFVNQPSNLNKSILTDNKVKAEIVDSSLPPVGKPAAEMMTVVLN
jgi:hypothetical protein